MTPTRCAAQRPAHYLRTSVRPNRDEFNQLSTGDALVSDESHEYRGAAIKMWIEEAIAKYKPVADVTDLKEVGEQIFATAQVSGSFPGSPAQIRYKFTLRNGKITALAIGA